MSTWFEVHVKELTVAAGVVLLALVVLLIVFLAGGFKAEPNYTTWCDNPSHNRIYQSNNGDIAVVPADVSCGT